MNAISFVEFLCNVDKIVSHNISSLSLSDSFVIDVNCLSITEIELALELVLS